MAIKTGVRYTEWRRLKSYWHLYQTLLNISDATFNENSCQLLSINDTHRRKLYFTQFILQEVTETNAWLLLTFFICLQNQLSSIHLSVLNLVGLAPPCVFRVSCHRVIVSSWVQNFSRGYFVGPRFFIVGRLWVQEFFSWVFCGFKTFSGEYFVGPRFLLVGDLWIQCFFSRGYVLGSKLFLLGIFVGPKFFLVKEYLL